MTSDHASGSSASSETKVQPDGTPRRKAMFIVFLVVFIDLLGFGIVLPLLPLYADRLLTPLFPAKNQQVIHGIILGLLLASFSAMQFIFAPIWGRISDRVGRRPILLIGLTGSVVFYLLFAIASELGDAGWVTTALVLLFVFRIGAGIAGATISTAQAVIADCTPQEERSRGMALIGAAFGIGFTFGPLFGFASLYLKTGGAPGFFASGLSLVALLLAVRLLPETLRKDTAGLRRNWFDWGGMLRTLKTPTIATLVITFFLATMAFGGLESTLAIFNKVMLEAEETKDGLSSPAPDEKTNTSEESRGLDKRNFLIFAYVGFILMLIQGGVYRPLAKRVSEITFMRVGLAVMALGLALACWVAWLAYQHQLTPGRSIYVYVLPVLTVAVTGFAFLTPSIQSLISRRSDPARQGEVLGVNQSASALARILGPVLGVSTFYLHPSHIIPYAVSALLMTGVFIVSLRTR